MKKKIDLGLIILLASFLVGILCRMRITTILGNFLFAVIEPTTLKLVGSILLIFILGNLLNEGGNLRNINSSLEALIKDRRVTLVIPSMLIGLLPVAAGAMLSAPIVEESGNKMGLTAENKTFLNYWFRHIWEYTWPLYPGLILVSAILNVPLERIVLAQLPLTLAAILSGCIFGLRKIPYEPSPGRQKSKIAKGICSFLLSAWPILAVVFFVLVLKLELILSLLIIILFVLITTKIKRKRLFVVLKNSISLRMILLIISVMVFKRVLENSGLLSRIPEIFNYLRISPLVVLFSIPLFIGLLTGLTHAFVGVAFPILLSFIKINNPNLTYVMLAYAGGFAGVLLSPVHLCLIVTRNYFKANLSRVYKLLLLPVVFVVLIAFMIVFVQRFI